MKSKLVTLPLDVLIPREDNPRLFMAGDALQKLVTSYEEYEKGNSTLLPDPPRVRAVFTKGDGYVEQQKYEILRGHRRVVAASMAGLTEISCRLESLSDEEAYQFIFDEGEHVSLTTIELAHRSYEMEQLGLTSEEINTALGGGVSLNRYLVVGSCVDTTLLTDTPKLCDPSITLWYEAALHGQGHFVKCLRMWDLGLWDGETCAKEFRKKDQRDLPTDNKQKGLRLSTSTDGQWMNVIGRLDAGLLTGPEMAQIWERFKAEGDKLLMEGIATGNFGEKYRAQTGKRFVMNLNPDTLGSAL